MTSRRALTLLELLFILAVVAIVAAVLIPNFMRPKNRGTLTSCKSNLKNIATALEMYASDNKGDYPPTLDELTRKSLYGPYLKTIPTCQAADKMTYTNYQVSQRPQAFSFACCGNNHGRAYTGFAADCSNYPQYHSEQGLIDHPPVNAPKKP